MRTITLIPHPPKDPALRLTTLVCVLLAPWPVVLLIAAYLVR